MRIIKIVLLVLLIGALGFMGLKACSGMKDMDGHPVFYRNYFSVEKYKDDYCIIYKDILDKEFGDDWELVESKKIRGWTVPEMCCDQSIRYTGIQWTIEYIDENKEMHTFVFNNTKSLQYQINRFTDE